MFKRTLLAIHDHVRASIEGRSPQWYALVRKLKAEHPYCAGCGGTKQLQGHHKKPFHKFPELELDPTNVIILCEQTPFFCHYGLGHLFDWKSWNVLVDIDAPKRLSAMQNRPY